MVFLLFFLIILLLICTILLTTKFQITGNNIYILVNKKADVRYNFNIKLNIYIFNIVPIYTKQITEKILEDKKEMEKIKQKIQKRRKNKIKDKKSFIRRLKLKIKYFDSNINIGLQNVIATSLIVPVISGALSIVYAIFLPQYKNIKYVIQPIYNKKYSKIEISLNTKIEFKLISILNAMAAN